jgi:16S rRNA (guanine(966)-N(2))-methyltransferase RsmD
MRIIAGEFRGRKLLPPEGEVTRPVTDRVKQSLFDILTPHLADALVYDCFAGTGSMGLECLSRGAKHATFFEADRSAVARLRKNIESLGLKDRTTIVSGDLFKWFANSAANGKSSSLIFLDPPYRFLREQPGQLQSLAIQFQHHLNNDGIVIFRHDAADALPLTPLQVADVRTYGSMTLEFLRPPATNNPQPTTDN